MESAVRTGLNSQPQPVKKSVARGKECSLWKVRVISWCWCLANPGLEIHDTCPSVAFYFMKKFILWYQQHNYYNSLYFLTWGYIKRGSPWIQCHTTISSAGQSKMLESYILFIAAPVGVYKNCESQPYLHYYSNVKVWAAHQCFNLCMCADGQINRKQQRYSKN